jgi:hypothetical protein
MNWLLIILAVVQAAIAAALIYRAAQLASQLSQTQNRVRALEDELKAMADSDAVPMLEAAQSLTKRMGDIAASAQRIQQPTADPAAKLASEMDGWLDYVPRLVDIFAQFAAAKEPPEREGKAGAPDES